MAAGFWTDNVFMLYSEIAALSKTDSANTSLDAPFGFTVHLKSNPSSFVFTYSTKHDRDKNFEAVKNRLLEN